MMRAIRRLSFTLSLCGLVAMPALAEFEPGPSRAQFDAAGALQRAPVSGLGGGGIGERIDDWNLWTRVNDGSTLQSEAPELARDELGIVHCAFTSSENMYFFLRLQHAVTLDGNESWSDPNILAAHSSDNDHIMGPVFAKTTTSDLWIVYSQYRPVGAGTGVGMRIVRSSDGGATFGEPVVIDDGSPGGVYDLTPSALSYGNTICAAWYEYDSGGVRFNRSVDAGDTWLPADVHVNDAYPNEVYSQPVLAHDPALGLLYLVWASRTGIVWISSSTDHGDSWSAPQRVSDLGAASATTPSACIDDAGVLYVIWSDYRSGEDTDVYFARSVDQGSTWTEPAIKIHDEVIWGNQYEPHLDLAPDGVLHAAFIHNIPWQMDVNLFYTRSTDGGLSWDMPTSQVNDVPHMVAPHVPYTATVLGGPAGGAFAAWRDMREVEGSWTDVFCASNLPATGIPGEGVGFGGALLTVSPNPARESAEFLFAPTRGGQVRLRIYDVQGKLVAEGRAASGGSWHWDLRDLRGRPVPSGLYLARAEDGERMLTRSLAVLR